MNKTGRTFLWYLWLTVLGARAEFSITSPIGASWEIGTPNIISWQEIDGPLSPPAIDLHLMQGSPSSLQLIANIATAVDTKSGQYVWVIPETIKPEANYAIQASEGKLVKYSPFFEITGQQTSQTMEEIDESSEPSLSSPSDPEFPSASLATVPTSTWESAQTKMNSSNLNKLNISGAIIPSKTTALGANSTKAPQATSKSVAVSCPNNNWVFLTIAASSLGYVLLV
ncbi:hypothetical protein K493DRAFT_304407 [Basidiobolus meristosporus CBS 931.73]|uniref:Yeast cell wall synthesis Kre9/Knh1-like N-terminal domain-containing protein n=1 Tax=Basidiobolus meristosporus CBS 931.73 TaxID=1314790 RepID=A0A1Y1Y065_9FUNG|nr:hypothetical protein K493DRAFT_304407 [Basidiobolus meristosporus CBS 931.73]|eukprot:ORX91014.1 hypothetical protein K493DRAFT_304407 [Basidiobolus meristosporus CBS 931.73]